MRDARQTDPDIQLPPGNALFESAVIQMGLPATIGRILLHGALTRRQVTPQTATPDDLRAHLPEIARRLQLVSDAPAADAAILRLRRLLMRA